MGRSPQLLPGVSSKGLAPSMPIGIPAALEDLFPGGGIRRGSTVAVGAESGGVSLVLALVATVTSGGGWTAVVGLPSIGLVAAKEMGVRLENLALVPDPAGRWPAVAAALLEGVDLLVVAVQGLVAAVDARRLSARARERRGVLLVLEKAASRWPERVDARLLVSGTRWEGLGEGHGHLRARRVEVTARGRGMLAGERRTALWLPGPSGALERVAGQVTPEPGAPESGAMEPGAVAVG